METVVFLSVYLTNSPLLKSMESVCQSVRLVLEPVPRCQGENSLSVLHSSWVFQRAEYERAHLSIARSWATGRSCIGPFFNSLNNIQALYLWPICELESCICSADKASFLQADSLDVYQLLQVQFFNHNYQRPQEKLNRSWIWISISQELPCKNVKPRVLQIFFFKW